MSNGDGQQGTQTIDWSKYDAPQQIDFSKYETAAPSNPADNFQQMQEQIKSNPFRALQIPFEQMGVEADKAQKAIQDRVLADAAKGKGMSTEDYVKEFALGSGRDLAKMVGGALSPTGIATSIAGAAAPEVVGPALLIHGATGVVKNAPAAVEGNPDAAQQAFASGAEMAGGGALGAAALKGQTPIQQTWQASRNQLRRLSGAIQTPAEAAATPPAGQRVPALAVSNQDVINEAAAEGIDLTPAQATREPAAQMIQATGERSLTPAGWDLHDALMNNRLKFEQSIEDFTRRHDPYALGRSPSSAGSTLQQSAKVALEVAKDNAEIAYKQAGVDQQNLAVHNAGDLKTWVDSLRNVRQPAAAVAQPEYQTPAVNAAMNDIASKPEQLGKNPSIQSMRNLRTEFWEKSQDYSGNTPDSARRLYSQAASKVDDMIMNAAQGTPFEQSFRDGSAQWKALKQKFDDPTQPMSKLLSATDPKQALQNILAKKSPTDVAALKNEGIDLGPLQSQVIQDIASKGFRVKGNALGGYPDEFIQQLFGPDAARELYVKGEIGRRLGLEVNPSGTSNVILARDQLGWKPWNWARGEAAARASMPSNPGKFVGQNPTAAAPSLSSLHPGPISLRAIAAAMERHPSEQGQEQ